MIKTVRLSADSERLIIIAHKSDGSHTVIVAKIVNDKGLRRVLKSHAKFHGLTLASDGLSAEA